MGPPKVVAGKEAFSRESVRVATWPYYLFAIAAGAMLPIQFGINAQLADWVASPLRATLVSFVVGASVLVVATLLFARSWPSTEKLGAAPWWVWVGGCLGAFYVLGSVVTAPKLGAAAFFVFILAGQAVASLAVDHFGWVGFDESPITPGRLLGIALVAAGVAAVRFL
jgi:bacterial/archaeal transporter family-2 protein